MNLRRPIRNVIALITAALLLFCQLASAAQACAHSVALEHTSVSGAAPCHHVSGGTDPVPQTPAARSSCDAPKAVSGAMDFSVLAITDLPALAIVAYDPLRVSVSVRDTSDPYALCRSPPPLTLLHCRLLN